MKNWRNISRWRTLVDWINCVLRSFSHFSLSHTKTQPEITINNYKTESHMKYSLGKSVNKNGAKKTRSGAANKTVSTKTDSVESLIWFVLSFFPLSVSENASLFLCVLFYRNSANGLLFFLDVICYYTISCSIFFPDSASIWTFYFTLNSRAVFSLATKQARQFYHFLKIWLYFVSLMNMLQSMLVIHIHTHAIHSTLHRTMHYRRSALAFCCGCYSFSLFS